MSIHNPAYREFLDKNKITPLTQPELSQALTQVKGKYPKAGRAMIILLYYTGCRPVEALMLKSEDVQHDGQNLIVSLKTAKRGVAREVYLPLRNAHIKELRDFAYSTPPGVKLFYGYISKAIHVKKNYKGDFYMLPQTTARLHYFFRQWFKGIRDITPYFLRHNCFSRLAELGHSELDIKYVKGAKSTDSVQPYLHISSVKAKKMSSSMGKI